MKDKRKLNLETAGHLPAARPTIGMFTTSLGGFFQVQASSSI
jgi:hypothetical protein